MRVGVGVGVGMVKDTTTIGDEVDDWPVILHAKVMTDFAQNVGVAVRMGRPRIPANVKGFWADVDGCHSHTKCLGEVSAGVAVGERDGEDRNAHQRHARYPGQ